MLLAVGPRAPPPIDRRRPPHRAPVSMAAELPAIPPSASPRCPSYSLLVAALAPSTAFRARKPLSSGLMAPKAVRPFVTIERPPFRFVVTSGDFFSHPAGF